MIFDKDSSKDRCWRTGFPSLIRTCGYHGSNKLHDLLAALKELEIPQLLFENFGIIRNVYESVHAFVHVLAFIA